MSTDMETEGKELELQQRIDTLERKLKKSRQKNRLMKGELEALRSQFIQGGDSVDAGDKFQAIIKSMEDGVMIEDERGKVIFANDALVRMLGYANWMEVCGRPWSHFFSLDEESPIEGSIGSYESRLVAKNGHQIPIIISSSSFYFEEKYVGVLSVIKNITNRKHMEEELRKHRDHLQVLVDERTEELNLKNQLIEGILNRYLDKQVIEQILSNPDKYLKLGGIKTNVAVVFCDIRGFTSLAEKYDAHEVIEFLNTVFEALMGVVFEYRGTFDKYIGDCLMAFWGAPVSEGNDADAALSAAIEMMKTFETLRSRWEGELGSLGIGIGINYGMAVVGNIGSENAMDYTVIGDNVNIASRIQSVAGPGEILVTRQLMDALKTHVNATSRGHLQLKGKSREVEIFQVDIS